MEEPSFRALVVRQTPDGAYLRDLVRRDVSDLPPGEILVRVSYSSLNYKDALAASGRRGVARSYPLTPGIDAVGTVMESSSAAHAPGTTVLVCGNELGIGVPGGFGQCIRVPAAWALEIPPDLSERDSMIYGTAGFTAAFSLFTLERYGLEPGQGEVLVTGASGGVGSCAVAILARCGYPVVAATGKAGEKDWLLSLGARRVVSREEVDDDASTGLLKERWTAVIDTVGGSVLAAAIKSTTYGGAVAACGNARSAELPITVFPFILRGVRLLGIESARSPREIRKELWGRLAGDWRPRGLEAIGTECTLEELSGKIDEMLQGRIRGRVVVKMREG